MLGCLWVVCGFRDLWLRYSFSQAVIVGWIVLVCVLGCWVCVLWWLVALVVCLLVVLWVLVSWFGRSDFLPAVGGCC